MFKKILLLKINMITELTSELTNFYIHILPDNKAFDVLKKYYPNVQTQNKGIHQSLNDALKRIDEDFYKGKQTIIVNVTPSDNCKPPSSIYEISMNGLFKKGKEHLFITFYHKPFSPYVKQPLALLSYKNKLLINYPIFHIEFSNNKIRTIEDIKEAIIYHSDIHVIKYVWNLDEQKVESEEETTIIKIEHSTKKPRDMKAKVIDLTVTDSKFTEYLDKIKVFDNKLALIINNFLMPLWK